MKLQESSMSTGSSTPETMADEEDVFAAMNRLEGGESFTDEGRIALTFEIVSSTLIKDAFILFDIASISNFYLYIAFSVFNIIYVCQFLCKLT